MLKARNSASLFDLDHFVEARIAQVSFIMYLFTGFFGEDGLNSAGRFQAPPRLNPSGGRGWGFTKIPGWDTLPGVGPDHIFRIFPSCRR